MDGSIYGSKPNFFHPHFFSEKLLNAPKQILYNIVVNLYIPVMIPSGPLWSIHEDENRHFLKLPLVVLIGPKIILHYV
jgi:hypothetical protein